VRSLGSEWEVDGGEEKIVEGGLEGGGGEALAGEESGGDGCRFKGGGMEQEAWCRDKILEI
jgi:hypothetical protein